MTIPLLTTPPHPHTHQLTHLLARHRASDLLLAPNQMHNYLYRVEALPPAQVSTHPRVGLWWG